ncbi:5-hydroxytryptamine receptor-like isoform X3 [Rhodnius prolixus]|uniref:5-hydroxytryptamine receptor-like isoform X3 n=1 Tax=Rhodnius prolixus TaxID=13249 RepID=UPI003D18C01E
MNSTVSQLVKRSARRPWRWPWKHRHLTTRLYEAWSTAATTAAAAVTAAHWPVGGGRNILPTISLSHATVANDINTSHAITVPTFGSPSSDIVLASSIQSPISTDIVALSGTVSDSPLLSWPDLRLNETLWFAELELANTSTTFIFGPSKELSVATIVVLAFILGLIILATVIGNVFVIAAIVLERHLQNVANYLILSLAVADLLVACLVMPLSAVYEVSSEWTLGPELCDMWTSSDVLCCTASILHLVAIALDRYWAVTNIDYIHQRTGKRIGMMILIIWSVAFLVCIAPVLGWKDPGWEARISENRTCIVSQDIGYQIFATASSFYLPLLVILGLYWRIFQTARKRIRRRFQATSQAALSSGLCAAGAAGGNGGIAAAVVGVIGRPLPTISEATTTTTTTAFTNVSSTNTSPEKGSYGNGIEADPTTMDIGSTSYQQYSSSHHHHAHHHQQHHHHPPKRKSKEAADSKRERKAAKTLAIITGAFVICWLPFFIMAILLPVCNMYQVCVLNEYLFAFFLWLGYFNSTLNPIIYTIFSPEFRHAFKRILCGRRNSLKRRTRQVGIRHFQK